MKRKIIKQGVGGYTIYLLKKWVEERGLQAGEEVELEETEERLVVTAKTGKTRKEITIKLDQESASATRVILTNLYRLGYDLIKIEYTHQNTFSTIKKTVLNQLLGLEITKAEKNKCLVESLTEPALEKLDQIINRQFFIVKEVLSLLGNKEKNKESILEYLEEIKKYDNFSKRMINRKRVAVANITLFYTFLTLLTHASRYLLFITEAREKVGDKLKVGQEAFEQLHKLYLSKEHKYFYNLHRLEKEFRERYQKVNKNTNLDSYLYSFVRTVYLAASPLLDYSSLEK